MSPEEAKRLAVRIVNSWHGGPNLDEWASELTEMDAGTAGTAFIRLRRELDHAPSIAHYWRTYRELATPANQPPPCSHCDGTGWITTTISEHGDRNVGPCHCRDGQRAGRLDMSPSWRRTTAPVGSLQPDATSLAEYLARHPDDDTLARTRHPTAHSEA